MRLIRYLKTDFNRLITSWQFYGGIVGVSFLYLLAGLQLGYVSDVYSTYLFNGYYSTVILGYAFCAVPFSGCLIEDGEYDYWILQIQKGNLKEYVRSKVLTCFISGVLTMVFGVLLFALILWLRVPLFRDSVNMDYIREADSFGFLIYPQTIMLYFACSAGVNGMLGGIFAAISAYLSLYEPHRILTISAPLAGFYFLENFLLGTLHLPEYFNIWVIYGAGFSMFGNTLLNVIYALGIAIFFLWTVEKLMCRKLRGEICEIRTKTKNIRSSK